MLLEIFNIPSIRRIVNIPPPFRHLSKAVVKVTTGIVPIPETLQLLYFSLGPRTAVELHRSACNQYPGMRVFDMIITYRTILLL